MLDGIISELKNKIGGELMQKVGLPGDKAGAAVEEAGASLENITRNESPSSMLEMFTSGNAAGITGKLEQDYIGRLTSKLGLDPSMAARVKDMVLPALMSLIQSKGGDMLGSVLGGKGGSLGGDLAGKLGGLGKMFGK